MPSAASRSILGVRMSGEPWTPRSPQPWSSVKMTMKLGRSCARAAGSSHGVSPGTCRARERGGAPCGFHRFMVVEGAARRQGVALGINPGEALLGSPPVARPSHGIGYRSMRGCEKMGTAPSADRISSIESVAASGAKWTVPDFFTAPYSRGSVWVSGSSGGVRASRASKISPRLVNLTRGRRPGIPMAISKRSISCHSS